MDFVVLLTLVAARQPDQLQIKTVSPASNSSYSHILFAVKGGNVPLLLLNLSKGGGSHIVLQGATDWVSLVRSDAAYLRDN